MDALIDALFTQGYYIWDDFLTSQQVQNINAEMPSNWQAAKIGRNEDLLQQTSIRSDDIQWLSPAMGPSIEHYLALMEEIRLTVNRHLYLGLFEYEAHFAKYSAGDFYKKHLDSFNGSTNRRLTTVFYLNQDWAPQDGGELMMYDQNDQPLQKVAPIGGRLVVFLSETFPHEVLVSHRERYSIAGWFRVNGVTEQQLDISR